MRTTRSSAGLIGLLLATGMLSLSTVPEAQASCTGGGPSGFFYSYTYIVSPGENTPASIDSAYWALGFGNPVDGSGVDHGSWEDTDVSPVVSDGWLRAFGSANYPLGSWYDSGEIDGCITGKIAAGKSREIMVIAYSDQGPAPARSGGYFGVTAAQRGANGGSDFEFTFGGAPEFQLAPIPRAVILASWRPPSGGIGVLVRGPTLAEVSPGIVTDGSATAAELVRGYRLYVKAYRAHDPAPADRRVDSGWSLVQDLTPLGQNASLILNISCDYMVLATSLVFESGFETQHVSSNSTPIQTLACDPAYDFDGDGYNIDPCCGPSDCNDADPAIHPFATEVCNGIDDDCDGLVDETVDGSDSDLDGIPNLCDDCVFAYNPAQHDLDHDGQGDACDLDDGLTLVGFAQPAEVGWQAESGYLAWNLYRGDLGVLASTGVYTQAPGSNALARRDCDLVSPRAPDLVAPAVGGVAFSLVSGESVSGEGSLGKNSQGVERPNTRPCP